MGDGRDTAMGSWWVTTGARQWVELSPSLARLLDEKMERTAEGKGVVAGIASEVVEQGGDFAPDWAGADTFYLIFCDVPLPALMRLPTLLGLHKPDRRLHVTRDSGALRRLLVASRRSVPMEGIVDAYVVAHELVLVLGDLSVRSFPREEVPRVGELPGDRFAEFELDPDGSYLRWPAVDVDLGVSGLLQAVDPMYLADVEIARLSREDIGGALRAIRERRGLRQRDIPDLSERQVRRLEKGSSRLTAEAAAAFAEAFDLSLERFLELLGERIGAPAEKSGCEAATV